MTLKELKERIMFQTNNDADDLGDFLPHITDYINEGYDKIVFAWCGEHVSVDSDNYIPLSHDKSQPDVPDWTHRAIADWATWLIYRNGNSNKQSRGAVFRSSFAEVERQIASMTGKDVTSSKSSKFYNLPK